MGMHTLRENIPREWRPLDLPRVCHTLSFACMRNTRQSNTLFRYTITRSQPYSRKNDSNDDGNVTECYYLLYRTRCTTANDDTCYSVVKISTKQIAGQCKSLRD